MAKSNANNPAVITCYLGTVSTTGVYPLTTLPRKFVITGIYLLDKAGIAADNTNYVTLTVKQGSTAVAALDSRAANKVRLRRTSPKRSRWTRRTTAACASRCLPAT
jgi:hypothetical protein